MNPQTQGDLPRHRQHLTVSPVKMSILGNFIIPQIPPWSPAHRQSFLQTLGPVANCLLQGVQFTFPTPEDSHT